MESGESSWLSMNSGAEKSRSGFRPFSAKMQVSPHDSISRPSMVMVITLESSHDSKATPVSV